MKLKNTLALLSNLILFLVLPICYLHIPVHRWISIWSEDVLPLLLSLSEKSNPQTTIYSCYTVSPSWIPWKIFHVLEIVLLLLNCLIPTTVCIETTNSLILDSAASWDKPITILFRVHSRQYFLLLTSHKNLYAVNLILIRYSIIMKNRK